MFTQKSCLCCYCFKRKGPCSLESFYCEWALNKITDTRKVQKGGLICIVCFWKVTLFQGWQDGSVSKGTCHQVWWLGFGPWDAHGRRRELILASYPLTSACVPQNMFPTTTKKINTIAILNNCIPSYTCRKSIGCIGHCGKYIKKQSRSMIVMSNADSSPPPMAYRNMPFRCTLARLIMGHLPKRPQGWNQSIQYYVPYVNAFRENLGNPTMVHS